MAADGPTLRVVDPDATPDEVAAIVAAVGAALASAAAAGPDAAGSGSRWVHAARLSARRSGLSRGEWRLSGRIGRRARA